MRPASSASGTSARASRAGRRAQGFDEFHVGVFECADGTLYRESMQRSGMPEAAI